MLQEISKIRSELQSERQEKELILEAVYGNGADDEEGGRERTTSLDEINGRAEDPKVTAERTNVPPSTVQPPPIPGGSQVQMKVLQVQRAALEERLEELEMNEQVGSEHSHDWHSVYSTCPT